MCYTGLMSDDAEKLNRVEELKEKLFSRNYEMKVEHRDNFTHPDQRNVPSSWADAEEESYRKAENFFMQTSKFQKFFKWSMIFFAFAAFYAAYTFFAGSNTVSSENIEIAVLGNSFTDGGEELSFTVSVTNRNSSSLELVDLVVEYPKNSQDGALGSTERMRETLGTIPAGGIRNENIKLVLFGEQGSIKPIKLILEYRVEGSNAIFVKEKIHEVSISSTPIDLILDAPSVLSPNQEIILDVKAVLNSTNPLSDILVKMDYPVGFKFSSANPKPALGNNIWSLGDLAPGTEREIRIAGRMVDVYDGEEKTFRVWSGTRSPANKSEIDVVLNSLSHTVLMSKPFIEARLFIDGVYKNDYVTTSKSKINGEIRYANNLDTVINDLEIRAKLGGNALDKRSINADFGFYSSTENAIIWNKSYHRQLAEVNPGDSGVLTFSMMPTSLFSGGSNILNEPEINIDISIRGKAEGTGFETQELKNSESKTIRIISDVGFANKALYYSGAFKNTGPIPPKVGQETTYTVIWTLSNSANNISNAVVRSSLPSWVKYMSSVYPATENVEYNSSTREITWHVGSIKKGAGIYSAAKELSFQIGLTPSLSQVNSAPTIINEAVLTGHDDFANVDVRVTKPALSTNLVNDASFPDLGERVKE